MSEKFYPPEDRDPTASPAPEAPSEDFDALLRSALPELPPQDVVREVTPLGGTVKLITWGLTLCSVTLNIGSLLPLLMRVSGTLLCLFGFRRLRRENGWFRACYGLAILRLALDWAGELRQTTLLRPPAALETAVREDIAANLPVEYVDDQHVSIGGRIHRCTGPRTHVSATGEIVGFRLLPRPIYDDRKDRWLLVGRVGPKQPDLLGHINNVDLE